MRGRGGRGGRGDGDWGRAQNSSSHYPRTNETRNSGAGQWQNSGPGSSGLPPVDGGGDRNVSADSRVQTCIRDEENNWDNDDPLPPRRVMATSSGNTSQGTCIRDEIGNWDEDEVVVQATNGFTDLSLRDPASLVGISFSAPISFVQDGAQNGNPQTRPRPSVETGKEYVQQYQKHLEAVIEKVSRKEQALDPRAEPYSPNSDAGSSAGGMSSVQSHMTSMSMSIVGSVDASQMNDPDSAFENVDMSKYLSSTRKLAIYALKDEIIATLNAHQVTIIEGYTGCGKTTQIPQYILDTCASTGRRCNIVVTQPRRIAAQSVADRVCHERSWRLGELVGYQVGLSRRTSENTRLTYLTTGVLLQTLITRRSLQDYSHIIVDEVHERDLDTDLLLLVLKKLMVEKEDRHTKIILMSATLNADKFADYFPKWGSLDQIVTAGIVKIPQKCLFKVEEYYLDTAFQILGEEFSSSYYRSNTDSFEEPKLSEFSYETAIKIIESFDALEASSNRPQIGDGDRGGVLAFLPGLMEIDTLYKMCNEYSERKAIESGTGSDVLQWTIIPLHSTITSDEQQKVFCTTQRGHRKIILATNIAESSITVTDICYVIDFCLTKSVGRDPQTNYSCLRMEWASQDQCVQRKGRVGRVSDGFVFRMVPLAFYNSLAKDTVPEFEKACLESVVLCVKTLNLGSPKAILALAIDPPALPSIQNAIANLKEVGALTIESHGKYTAYDGDLTEMGRLMSKLPFDIRFSRLIALGHIFGVLEETIIIAAGLSVKSAFSHPFHRRLLAYMSKLSWSSETFSDCFAILTLYRTWHHRTTSREFRGSNIRDWARSYFVQVNVLREMKISISDIKRRLANHGISVDGSRIASMDMSAEQGLMLKIVMAGAFYPNYFLSLRSDQREYERNISRELSGCDPLLTLMYRGFPHEQPGDLYAEHITMKYQWPNSIPYVKFAGSKALVEFDSRGAKIGPLSLNLFRGIKMRHVRNQVSFKALKADDSYAIRDEELGRLENLVRIKAPPACELPSVAKNEYMITLTYVSSPAEFWVVYKKESAKLKDIQTLLMQHVNVCSVVTTPVAGGFCITLRDGDPHRARIDYVSDNFDILLLLVDLGISMWKKPHQCYEFNQKMIRAGIHKYPGLAMKCRIVGIRPPAKYAGTWDEQATLLVGEGLADNRNTMLMFVYSVVDGTIACDLFGKGTGESGRDLGLRDRLLSDKLAREVDESKESQENNNIRANHGFYSSEDQIQRYNESQLCKPCPPPPLRAPQMEECIQDCLLRGPYSPLEMNFKALTASAHIKAVSVDGISVNSVSLDQDPYSRTGRLLVAAGVGISQRTGNVIARETTLMPPIPGLVALLTMIFCPKMQLRSEKSPDAFSGCLSGLGIDPIHHEPVYPDHDMEVVFDTHFDAQDIERINHVRRTMNTVLKNEERSFDIEHLRLNARREIRTLLERERPTVEETFPSREHAWALPKQEKTRQSAGPNNPGNNKGFSYGETDVFPLHETKAVEPELRSWSPDSWCSQ